MRNILIVIVAVGTVLLGCADDHTNKTKAQALETGASLAGTEWVLTGYKNTQLAEGLRNRSTIKFSAEPTDGLYEISGRAFINSYFGKFEIDESNRVLSPVGGIGATKMGGSHQDMQAEIFYFEKLGKVTSFKIDENDQLTLYFGDEEVGYFTKK